MTSSERPPEGGARRGGLVLVELIRFVIVVLFTALGYQVSREIVTDPNSTRVIVGTIVGAGLGYVVGGVLGRSTGTLVGLAERRIASIPGADLVSGGLGLVAGLVIAAIPGLFLLLLPSRAVGLPILAFLEIVFGYLGYRAGVTKREDVLQLVGLTYRTRAADLRVLDTSAILNTQLLDYVRAGLIRGTVLVPVFVLEEAQGIADAADPVRRQRARRGLEALAAIRREGLAEVRSVDKQYPEYDEVDAKVVALARERGAAIVTDDSALAHVAELQGVEVVHLRRVAAALRPAVLPGEAIRVELTRAGKEPGQAVGYLDDGTMVVVAEASARVGAVTDVIVNRVVPSAGGRMIFGRLAEAPPSGADLPRQPGATAAREVPPAAGAEQP
ncbi:MAG: PIN domain-containing protein [Actinomycetota bacterium]